MDIKDFIRFTVHEVNTPLSIIYGYSDLLSNGIIIESDKVKSTAEKMKSEVGRLTKFVEEISVYMGIKAGNIYTDLSEINLREQIESVAKMLMGSLNTDVNITIDGDGYVMGNRELYRHLIKYIIENGIIYNDNEEKNIYCCIDRENGKVRLTVEDNGIGINIDEREAVFECFYRVNKEQSRNMGGNGMGLSICRMIAEVSNIRMRLESGMCGGTKVTVIF